MRFLIDAQLPPALAGVLTAQGHEAEHVEELGLRDAKDSFIWNYAMRNHAVILTKDEDFADWFRRRHNGPIIVWLRIGNAINRVLLDWFLPNLPTILRRIQSGDRFIEVR